MAQRLYLDHAATTPMLLAAREAMRAAIARWANPSSPHAEGRAARAQLEDARQRIAAMLGWDGEVIFTGGATEAIRIALTRAKCDARLVSAVEHDAVHRVAPDAYFLPVQTDGTVLPDALSGRLRALGAKAPLVAVQAVNNETGVCQPLDRLAPIVRRAGGLLLADCAQSAGKMKLPDADLIAVSAHKFGGPPGVGALLVRDFAMLEPSGGQERGYRAGTENLPGAAAMAAALEQSRGWVDRAGDLRAHLDGAIEASGGEVVAKKSPRLATIASYRMPGVAASAQLIQLDLAGIAVSAGSACSSGTLKTSHVLAAMGWQDKEAGEVIRVSFGPETSRADIYRFIEAWRRIADGARSRAA
ncbi:cysteine desulfurase family protein [Sphingomonas sp. ID1715]|uniref:cysteine desulfurase family protein n=1 Tax=Sphingomonas sp. ID1715 TaxID=1656898 RepID=UPI00266FEEE2|nr:aminotransferase class V-fold PLP-dependent enzyme [Sphingomonas sp. ID1715]